MRSFLLVLASLVCSGLASAQLIKVLPGGDLYDGPGGGGPISGSGGQVYWVQGQLRVPKGKKLTLRQVNFKFNDNTGLRVEGALEAYGYFSSIHDDLLVGDTNFNGGATVPAPGKWTGIQFGNGAAGKSLLQGVVRYAGSTTRGAVDCIGVPTAAPIDLTFSHFNVIDSKGPGITLGSVRALLYRTHVEKAGSYAIEGTWPNVDRVVECTARNCAKGDFILRRGINGTLWPTTSPNRHFAASQTLNQSGVFVAGDTFVVPQIAKLSFAPGTTLKMFDGARVAAQGSLEIRGTAQNKIVLTSIHDDSVGGDTNKNGSATQPKPGSWGAIQGDARAGQSTVLEHTEIRYAGGWLSTGIYNSARDLVMHHVVMRDIRGFGVKFVSNSTRGTHSIRNCTFERVENLIFDKVPLDSLAQFRGNVHGAGTKRAYSVEGLARRNLRVDIESVPERVLHLTSPVTPASGTTTTIGAGLVLKCTNTSLNGNLGRLDIRGTPSAPVVLTSIHDDSAMGDTNGNGSATQPAPGNWTGVRYTRDTDSTIEHTEVRYAGTGVSSSSKNAIVRAVRVDDCARDGFYFNAVKIADNLVARGCKRSGLGLHVSSSAPTVVVRHATLAYNTSYGVDQGSGSSGNWRLVNSIVWGNSGGNFGTRVAAASVHTSCGGFANQNGNIDVDPRFASTTVLAPYTNSPCLDVADHAVAAATAFDLRGNSRISDWSYSGTARPDMGAIELVNASIRSDKPFGPRIGETILVDSIALSPKDNGVAVFLLGFEDLRVFIAPWGMLNAGLATLVPLATVPTGVKVPLPIPNDAKFIGASLAIQALHIPLAKPTAGNFTNLYRARIRG